MTILNTENKIPEVGLGLYSYEITDTTLRWLHNYTFKISWSVNVSVIYVKVINDLVGVTCSKHFGIFRQCMYNNGFK